MVRVMKVIMNPGSVWQRSKRAKVQEAAEDSESAVVQEALHAQSQGLGLPLSAGEIAEVISPDGNEIRLPRGFSAVLKNSAFLRLWLAQAISQVALNVANYGLIILVARETGSVTETALTIVAFTLPGFLFSGPAGVVVDRFDRHRVLWVSNLLRALVALLFVVALLSDRTSLVPLYLLAFCMTSVGAFFAPAEGASIPSLVKSEELVSALALFNITFTLAQAVGLVLMGPLILHWLPSFFLGTGEQGVNVLPVDSLYLIVAGFFFLCTGIVLTLPRQRLVIKKSSKESVSMAQEAGSGWRTVLKLVSEAGGYLRADQILFASIWQLTLGGVITAIIALIAPYFIVQFLRLPAELAGLVFVPAGLGLVLGSALMPRLLRILPYTGVIILGSAVMAICPALLTGVYMLAPLLHPDRWWQTWPYIGIILLVMLLMGLAVDCVTLPAQARMQERTSDEVRGRVLALQFLLLNGFTIPTVLVMGQLADQFGLVAALNVLAGVIAVTSFGSVYYGMFTQRRKPRAERK
jgi:MFS family permease